MDVATTLEDARTVASASAERAEVTVTDLHDHVQMPAVSRLFDAVWGRTPDAGAIMSPEALTALAHAGGQVSAAYRDERLVGATAAFIGLDDGVLLHSHITGVLAAEAGRGVGRALKWHQRAWCLERDIRRVRWTFDPLVRRNAAFNLVVLGARATAYRQDVYGPMADALNAGLPTDRLVAEWELTAARVVAAARGRAAEPDVDALRRAGAVEVLRVGDDLQPVVNPVGGDRRLVQVPPDIEALRASGTDIAAAWAAAVREALEGAMAAGFQISGFTHDGWYVLAADQQVRDLTGTA